MYLYLLIYIFIYLYTHIFRIYSSNSLTLDQTAACNVFDLMPSFLFYDIPASGSTDAQVQLSLAALLDLRNQYDTYELSERGYNASYAGASSSNPFVAPIMKQESWRNAAYEFCYTSSFGFCNLLTFHLFDSSKGVSAYYYQLQNGTCTDTIIMEPEAWDSLYASDPPAPLTQGYYKCTSNEYDALFNAAGIASGNIGKLVFGVLVGAL